MTTPPPSESQGQLFESTVESQTLPPAYKPSTKTSELYLTVGINLFCMLYGSGVIPVGSWLERAAAFVMAGLVSLGYINSRTKIKTPV